MRTRGKRAMRRSPLDHAESEADEPLLQAVADPEQKSEIVLSEDTEHVVSTYRTGPYGRPTSLTDDIIRRMALFVATGVSLPVASQAIGCGNKYKQWLTDARLHREQGLQAGWEPGQSPYLLFLEAVEEAKCTFEAAMALCVTRAAKGGDWKAAAWMLEKRAPERWREQKDVNVNVNDVRKMSTEQLLDLMKANNDPE